MPSLLDKLTDAAYEWQTRHRGHVPTAVVVGPTAYTQLRYEQRRDLNVNIDDLRECYVSTPVGRLEILIDNKQETSLRLQVLG